MLEHLDDDRAALAELRRVVRPGGALVVTVPAHPRLWSRHDELNHHRRRYTRASLRAAAGAGGWEVGASPTSTRCCCPGGRSRAASTAATGSGSRRRRSIRALELPLRLERRAIAAGVSFPFGLSLLAELR